MAKKQVVGLDIGDTQLRAVELSMDPRDPARSASIQRYAEVDLPPEAVRDGEVARRADVVHILRDMWRRHRFASKQVVLGIGGQRVIVRDAAFPAAPLDVLRRSLPYQVEDLIMVPVDESLLDFYPLAEADGRISGLLVAAPVESVQRNVDAVQDAGLRVDRVDLAAFGLVRALARGQAEAGVVGLVDVGAVMTTVAVARNGQPEMLRILPTGGKAITDTVARTLGIQEAVAERMKVEIALMNPGEANEQASAAFAVIAEKSQAMVEQIARTFSFYAQSVGQPVQHLVVSGRGGMLNGLGQYLSTALRLPASFSSVDSTFALEKGAAALTPEQRMSLPIAIGLAMGGGV
ncbi:MAG: type IV pilus assembly protein PilM [Bifidobacteriaceae bacterium]|jgi:type IV pilus assembly protein PilM|nr:type IV pilus assembly protein PilM [Bifidobacteriaceae bacterium]